MNLAESIRTALVEIRSHTLRSLLTLVGVILGTMGVIVMVSVIGGAAVSVQKGLSDLGFDGVIFVWNGSPEDRLERKKQGQSRGLRVADVRMVEEGLALFTRAAPMVSLQETALVNRRHLRVKVEGITPAYAVVRNRVIERGRYVTDTDLDAAALVCVIGKTLAEDVFGTDEPLGREMVIRGERFRIVGIMRSLGSTHVRDDEMAQDNRKVYAPLSTLQKRLLGSDLVHAFAFRVADPERLGEAQREAETVLRRSHRGISDFRVMNVGERIVRLRREVDRLIGNWRVVLASIAGVSLLVGGVGIFSVMQISISERVYEIGLRKSIGATDGAIFAQFLIEAVSLSLGGGCAGSALGYGITMLASRAFADGLTVSPLGLLLATGFAVLIGITAGVYPALRASHLSPVDAIRAL